MNSNDTKLLLEYTALTVINNTLFQNGIIDISVSEKIAQALRKDYHFK